MIKVDNVEKWPKLTHVNEYAVWKEEFELAVRINKRSSTIPLSRWKSNDVLHRRSRKRHFDGSAVVQTSDGGQRWRFVVSYFCCVVVTDKGG